MDAKSGKRGINKDTKYFIHSAIGVIIMFGFGYLPPFAPVTPLGMKYIGILLGLIYLWSLVEMLWPSMLGLVALILTGAITGAELTPKAFGTDMILIVILSLAIIFALTSTGIFDYFTNWLLSRKMLQGHPWRLTITILFGAYLIESIGGGIAILFLLWELIYKIADQAKITRSHRYCGLMAVALMMCNVLGLCLFPFKPTYLFIMGTFQKMTGMGDIPMIIALVMNFVIAVAMIIFYLLIMRFVLRVDLTALQNVSTDEFMQELPPMSRKQKFSMVYLILFIIMIILPGTVGLFSQGPFSIMLQRLGTVGMCYLMFGILYLVRIDGEPILVFSQVAPKIQWDAVALMAIAFTLSPMLTAEGTGVSEWMMQMINPLLGGRPTLVFMILVGIITICLTNIANNTVIMILMITVIGVFQKTMPINVPVMGFMMLFMSQIAFMLPASSFYGAVVHSQAGQVGKKSIYIGAISSIAAAILTMLCVMIPLGSMLL